MTNEVENIKKAKKYIDYLVNGVDPTDNMDVDEETLHNEQIIDCLKYVSNILERNIELLQPNRKRNTKAVFITDEQLSQLKVSDNCKVSDIANEINRIIIGNNTRKFQASWITNWLESKGYLCKNLSNSRIASEKGIDIGITSEIKQYGKNNCENYVVNYYNSNAQNFIFRHLDDIILFRYNGKQPISVNFHNIEFPFNSSIKDFIKSYKDKCFIISVGSCEIYSKQGSYKTVLTFRGKTKIFEKNNVNTNSANKCILYGVKAAADAIKSSTNIIILSSTPLGFNTPKSANYQICSDIISVLNNKNCDISIAVCTGKGDELQNFVKSQLQNYP